MARELENGTDETLPMDSDAKNGKKKKKNKTKEKQKERPESADSWADFGLRRLFNPQSTEFLPMEEQLKLYKHRDLSATKKFSLAARVFGHPRIRKRIYVAPKMGDGTGVERHVGTQRATAELRPQGDGRPRLEPIGAQGTVLTRRDKEIMHDMEVQERMTEYKSWLHDRMALRAGLESMGLKESWLKAKPNLTSLEQRVLAQLQEARRTAEALKLKMKEKKPVKMKKEAKTDEDELKPQPEGMTILADYLSTNKVRLLDLFKRADKDKSWAITREEFRKVIKEAKIPLSDELLNEMMDTLDEDDNLEVDYREFVQGMERYQLVERKRKIIEERRKSEMKARSSPVVEATAVPPSLTTVKESASTPALSSEVSQEPREGATPDSLASLLEIPKMDITERRALTPDDMIIKRKRERYQAANPERQGRLPRTIQSPIKTGNKAIDMHSQPSTLGGELAVEIHDYRAARLAEYHAICRLCEEREIPLTPKLLERALLHPGDKRVTQLKRRLRQPGTHTMSNKFAEPPKPPDSPVEYHDMEKVVVTKSGEVLVDSKHVYPKKQDVFPKPEMQNLSSGKAFISRKIDCWMSFEEYDKLTKHLKKRYISLENVPEHDVFWPGFLLDKIQLYMPETRSTEGIQSHALFQPTAVRAKRSNPGYNNDISYWLVSDNNYLKSGGIEERKVYNIDWK